MNATIRDLIFGTGDPFAFGQRERGEILATYRGPGRDMALDAAERAGLIASEQRLFSGSAATGFDELVDAATPTRALMSGTTGAAQATAGNAAAHQYANPVYGGLHAQQLMRETGFRPPMLAPGGAQPAVVVPVSAAPDLAGDAVILAQAPAAAEAPVAAAADDVAKQVVDAEQRALAALQRLGELPREGQVRALQGAIDATAEHGGDTYDVLARTLVDRPLEVAAPALERSIDDTLRTMRTVADDAAKVAAPVVDDVAKVTAVASKPVAAAVRPAVIAGGDDVARGLMSFSDHIDDALRLLTKI